MPAMPSSGIVKQPSTSQPKPSDYLTFRKRCLVSMPHAGVQSLDLGGDPMITDAFMRFFVAVGQAFVAGIQGLRTLRGAIDG